LFASFLGLLWNCFGVITPQAVLLCWHFRTKGWFLVMCRGQNFLTWVSLGQLFVARVRSGQPSLVWVWKISSKNTNFFQFFQKNCFMLGQRRVGLLFTAYQKYAEVGSGQSSQ